MTALSHRAFPVVLAAPSGTGKTTIARRLVASDPAFVFSVSATTRPRRVGEEEGKDYAFVGREAFQGMITRGELCEWAEVHGHLYGTPTRTLDEAAERGQHVVLDIDVQGARQIRERVPEAILVFIFPPSGEALAGRLLNRATEGSEELARRLRNAREELQEVGRFDFVVINDDLDRAVQQVRELVRGETHRTSRARALEVDVERIRRAIDGILEDGVATPGIEGP